MNEQENKSSFEPSIRFWIMSLCLIGLFLVLVMPRHERFAPMATPENNCMLNLLQIDAAANQFALEQHKTNGEAINFPSDLTPYIKLNSAGKIPSCPQGGIYRLGKVGEPPTCSLGTTVTPAHVLP